MKTASIASIAVAMITDGDGRLLWPFNHKWGVFALPMTKQRRGADGNEPMLRAALRVGAETLGVPVREVSKSTRGVFPISAYSERRLEVVQYYYHTFHLEPHPTWRGNVAQRFGQLWLSSQQMRDDEIEPLAEASRVLAKRAYPQLLPLFGGSTRRTSTAALALVCRKTQGSRVWLTQWNERWEAYHFVGGRLRAVDSSYRSCIIRKLREELDLDVPRDCIVMNEPVAHLEFTAQSQSTGEETDYRMELFATEIQSMESHMRIDTNPNNRWLTEAEIRNQRSTADDRPVSETMLTLLDQMGW